MSDAKEAPSQESWTKTIHDAIIGASESVHRAVNALAGHDAPDAANEDSAASNSSVSNTGSQMPNTSKDSTNNDFSTKTDGMTETDATGPSPKVRGMPSTSQSTPTPRTGEMPRTESDQWTTHANNASSTPKEGASSTLPSTFALKDGNYSSPSGKVRCERPPQDQSPNSSSSALSQTNQSDITADQVNASKKGDSVTSSQGETLQRASHESTDDINYESKNASAQTDDSGQQNFHATDSAPLAAGHSVPAGDSKPRDEGKRPTDNGQDGGGNDLNGSNRKSDNDAKISGIGKIYVRSTGTTAEGGDFDAAKPGAGVRFPFSKA